MFEKEAEEYICNGKCQDDITKNYVHCKTCTRLNDFLAGHKAGYNKANEWHYVKDGDLPKPTTLVLVILESGVPYVSWISSDKGWWFCTNYYTGEDKVIAWKEIVLPELPKESE